MYLLMAYTLGNKCAKNLCKRTVLLQLIIKNVVMFFGTQCIVGVAGNVLKFVMVSVCLSAQYVSAAAACCGSRMAGLSCCTLPCLKFVTFLPRDAYAQRRLCCGKMSVCLYVTRRYCVNGYTYPQGFFTIGQPHHSSISIPNRMAIFGWGPPNRGIECKRV